MQLAPAPICASYLGFLFYNSCAIHHTSNYDDPEELYGPPLLQSPPSSFTMHSRAKFESEFQWQYINFTWPTTASYRIALSKRLYVPENVAVTGIKYYNDRIFLSFPQIRRGVPFTLGFISVKSSQSINPLVTPYPSWEMNLRKDCSHLHSVQSMEIDKDGVMWVIDGFRRNNNTRCPSKLVLFNLNDHGKILLVYTFPNEISLRDGGFLNDIVIDHAGSEGDFAYITDNSAIDPGLIVFSRKNNRAWKLRDATMFPEIPSAVFVVGDLVFNQLSPIDGIALSPRHPLTKDKYLYFCSLSGLNLYSLNTKILRSETLSRMNAWQRNIKLVGKKRSQSDGLIVDNQGNMYYGLLPLYAVAKWNIKEAFSTTRIIDQNSDTMVWTDSFALDDEGNLRLLTNNINKFMDISVNLRKSKDFQFRILKLRTGFKSYLHDPVDHHVAANTENPYGTNYFSWDN